jgi:L-fucose mutarotase/ribose pyranase (RbsD/FucU family)
MVVLKGVPRILSPQLLFAMSRMGHGDELSKFKIQEDYFILRSM